MAEVAQTEDVEAQEPNPQETADAGDATEIEWSEQKQYLCPVCGRTSREKAFIEAHITAEHTPMPTLEERSAAAQARSVEPPDEIPVPDEFEWAQATHYRCPVCGRSNGDKSVITTHIAAEHAPVLTLEERRAAEGRSMEPEEGALLGIQPPPDQPKQPAPRRARTTKSGGSS